MKNYKYILFDLDGTITDSALGITNSVKYALKKLNAPIPPYETLCKFIGPPLLDGFRDLCGFETEKAQAAVKYYREYYETTGLFEKTARLLCSPPQSPKNSQGLFWSISV